MGRRGSCSWKNVCICVEVAHGNAKGAVGEGYYLKKAMEESKDIKVSMGMGVKIVSNQEMQQ